MRVLMPLVLVSFVCGYSPSRGTHNNPRDGGFGGQVVQQVVQQPPKSVSGQYWWQGNNNSPFAQQQQIAPQSDAVIQLMGICRAPVCPASSVCVHWQLCHNGFLIIGGSGQINQEIQSIPLQVQSTSQRCGGDMICCGVPSCNPPTPITNRPSIIFRPRTQPPNNPPVHYTLESQPSNNEIVRVRPVTNPPGFGAMMNNMMMMMGPMRSPGNCSAGLYCIERPECDRNGFVINNLNQLQAVIPGLPSVPLLSCMVRNGNIQDGVCCQQVHPNPQGFD